MKDISYYWADKAQRAVIAQEHTKQMNGQFASEIAESVMNSKIYSKDFIELLFSYPYTKIGSVENSLKITRQTAAKYLKIAQDLGIFKCVKLGKYSYFVNLSLYEILKKGLNIK